MIIAETMTTVRAITATVLFEAAARSASKAALPPAAVLIPAILAILPTDWIGCQDIASPKLPAPCCAFGRSYRRGPRERCTLAPVGTANGSGSR